MSKASKRRKTLLDIFSEKNKSTGNANVDEAENVAASEVAGVLVQRESDKRARPLSRYRLKYGNNTIFK